MKLMTQSEWYNEIGYAIEEAYTEWLDSCPDVSLVDMLPSVQEYLEEEYEALRGLYEDITYETYRDEQREK